MDKQDQNQRNNRDRDAGIKIQRRVELTEAPRATANKPQYKAWGRSDRPRKQRPRRSLSEYIGEAAGYMPADGRSRAVGLITRYSPR